LPKRREKFVLYRGAPVGVDTMPYSRNSLLLVGSQVGVCIDHIHTKDVLLVGSCHVYVCQYSTGFSRAQLWESTYVNFARPGIAIGMDLVRTRKPLLFLNGDTVRGGLDRKGHKRRVRAYVALSL